MAYLYPLVVVFRVFGLLIHQRRGDQAVGSGDFLSFACYYCLSYVLRWKCKWHISSVDNTPTTKKITWHILQGIIAYKRLRKGKHITTA
jgi:hypothetical protein